MIDDAKLLETVIGEFEALTRIPRPSGQERAVSDYLKKRFAEIGCTVTQDEVLNIIADMPASKGCESAPLTILQGHMDMVCVAEAGIAYDPLKDPIKLVRTEKYLTADGTSLGGDDGIGVAEILAVMQYTEEHGALRAIITVDEEQGMSGARRLDAEHLADARFLINCDSEDYHIMTVGSAGSVNLDFSRVLSRRESELPAYRIAVEGMLGGHSGERIGDGRGNAIRTLALALQALEGHGGIEIVSFTGGTARNAIPPTAEAIIRSSIGEREIVNVLVEEEKRFHALYGAVDPAMKFAFSAVEHTGRVIGREEQHDLIALLMLLRTGVHDMSRLHVDKVETSANIGLLHMDENTVSIQFFPRSSVNERLDEIIVMVRTMAERTNFNLTVGSQSPAWRERENSVLAKIMGEVYAAQNSGAAMKIESIHAGLETSWHAAKNPDLDMVSIGVTTTGIHTPAERVEIAAIVPEAKLMMDTLRRIAHEKG